MPASNNIHQSRKGLSSAGLRRPFWLPATAYYLLAFLFAFVMFLTVWGILQEGEEAFAVWLGASVGVVVFCSTVVVREVFLRRARARHRLLSRHLDEAVANARAQTRGSQPAFKISQKQNAEMLRRISKKSDAARELGEISRGHLEVFDLCGDYLAINKEQIEGANPGSPRLQDLRKGRDFVRRLHHYHLLAWAQIESTALTAAARDCGTLSGKFHSAREALKILESALIHYPSDTALKDSEMAVREFIGSLQITSWFETAEQQASGGDYAAAVDTLRRAVEFLGSEGLGIRDRELVKEKLESDIIRFGLQAQGARQRNGKSPEFGND